MTDFIIPIDDAVEAFSNHIRSNQRTVLSAKFGDGKSFFLQKVSEDERLSADFEFLTLYPVNYQVARNEDIFELIKRDILFQLMIHDMISDDVVIDESESFLWFLKNNGTSLFTDLLSFLAEINLESKFCAMVMTAMKVKKLFKNIKDHYTVFKEKNKDIDAAVEIFLEKTNDHFLYEKDLITTIIQKSVEDFRRSNNKKVALVVEDLDRIDPSHLFRILNVLSAHIDYKYKDAKKPDASLEGNKFGLDNIILVVDYHNLKSIYKHFYGDRTDFNGYISKFLSSVPFSYSLENQKYEYSVKQLSSLTELKDDLIRQLLPRDLLISRTIREIVQSFDINKSITSDPTVECDGKVVHLNTSFLKIMAILRRMKYTDEEIRNLILSLKDINRSSFVKYVLPYVFLQNGYEEGTGEIFINNEEKKPQRFELELEPKEGVASLGYSWARQGNEKESDFVTYINLMLSFVA